MANIVHPRLPSPATSGEATHKLQLTDIDLIQKFITGGEAHFTIVNTQAKKRFTYRIQASNGEGPVSHFVSAMTGKSNEASYKYIGHIFLDDSKYVTGKKSKLPPTNDAVTTWEWFYNILQDDRIAPHFQFWHEGRCCRCGKRLTTPRSIKLGIGPWCEREEERDR